MSRRFAILGAASCGLLGFVSFAVVNATPNPETLHLRDHAPPSLVQPSVRVVPDEPPHLEPAELLEQRLAALAREVERRQAKARPGGLVQFDVVALNDAIEQTLQRVRDRAQVSVHVRDLESQHVLFDYFGDAPLNPASNQKLLTTAAAIDLLGSDYVFQTKVAHTEDALFLIGEGDPTLDGDDLQAMANRFVEQASLHGIERIVVDETAFSARRLGPGYRTDGPGFGHESPSGALSLNFNTVEITVYRAGTRVGVSVFPDNAHVQVKNTAKLGRRNRLRVDSQKHGQRTLIAVGGVFPRRGRAITVRRRVADPGRFAGAEFAEVLSRMHATAPLPVTLGKAPSDAQVIVTHESPPLIEVVNAGLAYSNNFTAEQVLRTLGWRMTGDPGDWANGLDVLRGYWSALGKDPSNLVVENASGLSSKARITTSELVDLISVAHRTQARGAGLIDVLPVAGDPGTLHTRLRFSGKRIRAKTGTLEGVSGLSGVVTAEDGTPEIAFSILINSTTPGELYAGERRAAEDAIVTALLHYLDDYHARVAGVTDNHAVRRSAGR